MKQQKKENILSILSIISTICLIWLLVYLGIKYDLPKSLHYFQLFLCIMLLIPFISILYIDIKDSRKQIEGDT